MESKNKTRNIYYYSNIKYNPHNIIHNEDNLKELIQQISEVYLSKKLF